MEQKSIIHLSSAKSWRGGENQISLLMTALRIAGISQILFAPKGSPLLAWAKKHEFQVISYTKSGPMPLLAALKLIRISKKMDQIIWHIHDSHAHNIAYIASAFFKAKTPWVLTRRILLNNKKKGLSSKKYNHSSLKQIVGISNAVAFQLKESIHKPIPISVIPSCVVVDHNNEKGKLRAQYNLPEDDIIVGYAAALTKEKDHKTFLDVASRVISQVDRVYFVCMGAPGNSSEGIAKELERNPTLKSRLILTGFLPDPQSYMIDFDICLSTSLSEGLGTAMLECMGLGIPVVSTRSGGIEDWITSEENGYLTPTKDAKMLSEKTLMLIRDPGLRKDIGRAGKLSALGYTPKEMAHKYIETYNGIPTDQY